MVLFDHDYVSFPELTNSQLNSFGLSSPHVQIVEDFEATVIKVTDGDTIRLSTSFRDFDFPLRLLDIDAPELNAGGSEAKEWLKTQIEGGEVKILIDSSNRVGKFGRLLGKVFSRGLDVGLAMLYLGLVKPFGSRNEGQIPPVGKMFDLNQWF